MEMTDPDVHPVDYEPPRRSSGSSGVELAIATQKGRANPGHWVDVGKPRTLTKPPTSWCSEVNLGQKKELQVPGEKWEANYTVTGGHDDNPRVYQKMIRLLRAATAVAP